MTKKKNMCPSAVPYMFMLIYNNNVFTQDKACIDSVAPAPLRGKVDSTS